MALPTLNVTPGTGATINTLPPGGQAAPASSLPMSLDTTVETAVGTSGSQAVTIQGAAGGVAVPVDTVVKTTATDRGGLTQGGATAASLVAGGTGNAVGDVLTLVGGTLAPGGLAAQVTVSAVSSGAVTAVTLSRAGAYVAAPSGTLATTSSGSGTGAAFTVTFAPISFQLAAANSARRGIKIKSPATNSGTLWFSGTSTATPDYHSIDLLAGDYYASDPHEVGTGAINMIGSAIGLSFYAREF